MPPYRATLSWLLTTFLHWLLFSFSIQIILGVLRCLVKGWRSLYKNFSTDKDVRSVLPQKHVPSIYRVPASIHMAKSCTVFTQDQQKICQTALWLLSFPIVLGFNLWPLLLLNIMGCQTISYVDFTGKVRKQEGIHRYSRHSGKTPTSMFKVMSRLHNKYIKLVGMLWEACFLSSGTR